MAQIREIKKRMVAVGNIQRITKTMQMIATAKFTSSLQRAQATKPYTLKLRQLVGDVAAAAGDVDHALIRGHEQPERRELILVLTSDRGLCGAYNGNVLRTAIAHGRAIMADGKTIQLETSGKKAAGFFKFQKVPVDERLQFGDKPRFEEVARLADRYMKQFVDGEVDSVRVAYMQYISNARQTPEVLQLLPLQPPKVAESKDEALYEFSPSSAELLDDLLPRSVQTTLFQAFNDAVVSEQIMRMVAMKAATENAKELGRMLKRKFNRARQTQITTELMEVISGAAALE
ncbi:MAG: ATP synthase F1 subunit gamma [Planctomycetota bacterium]|jgi:F-type H+-transporting ATPase subunit gamma